jgi:hypothetical protein
MRTIIAVQLAAARMAERRLAAIRATDVNAKRHQLAQPGLSCRATFAAAIEVKADIVRNAASTLQRQKSLNLVGDSSV